MKFWKKAVLINLAVILVLLGSLTVFFATPFGRPALKTLLLVSEVVPNFPVRHLKYLSREPKVEEVTLKVGDMDIKADLYTPQDNKKHPAVIFTLGVVVTKQDSTVVKFAQSLSRLGFVVLVPDLPDFVSGFVWTDSVETLISAVEFLDRQSFVNRQRIGFAGFCVGASTSIVAAEKEQIADKVDFIAGISPYFDIWSSASAVITGQVKENSSFVSWRPADLTVESLQRGFINYVKDENERSLLLGHFTQKSPLSSGSVEHLSTEARIIYDFLSNTDLEQIDELWQRFPQSAKDLILELSPSTHINNLKARVFVLDDKKDTFIPRVEGEKLFRSLPKEQIKFTEIDSFEHVNPKTKLERWSVVKQIFHLMSFVYNILVEAQP